MWLAWSSPLSLRLTYLDAWLVSFSGVTSFSGCSIHFTLPKQCGAGEASSRWSIEKWFQLEHHQPAHVRCGPIRWVRSVSKPDGFWQPIQKRWAASISSLPLCVFLLDLGSFSGVFSRGVRGWHSTFCRLVGGVNSVSGVAMHLVGPIRCSCGTSGMELARSCDGFVYAMPLAGLPPCLLIHLAPFSQGW